MKKRRNLKKIALVLMIIMMIFIASKVIYAVTVEKTPIVCQDEKMFNALKDALSSYILLPGDVNKNTLTISIPTESLSQIEEINLEDKQISNITGIENLSYLTKINLGKNRITDISPLTNINSISELKLNDNNNLGNNVVSVLSSKTTITNLNLSSTGLTNIDFISNLTNLQELEIANGSFNSLNALSKLKKLKKLNVSGNQSIRTIQHILPLTELQSLNLSNTGINTLELDEEQKIGIYNLRKLKELYISGIDVESLNPIIQTYYNEHHHKNEYGDWIGEDEALLLGLEVLDISYIKKDEETNVYIPSFYELQRLENLRKLRIQGNCLTSVDNIYGMKALQEVDLQDNKITDLSGLIYKEIEVDEYGVSHEVIKEYLTAKSIDLSNNEIDDIKIFKDLPGKSNITYLNLSKNHINNISYIETVGGTVRLQDQVINFPVYKKETNTDQYILLCSILQNAKNPSSKLYDQNAVYTTNGCELNTDSNYQSPGLFNVIIDKNKTSEDIISISLSGGIADGTVINYLITDDTYAGIDSIIFKDNNLNEAIYQELYNLLKDEEDRYLVRGGNVLNVNHEVISRVTELNLSENGNISDITGLENFDNLTNLNISKNKGIKTIDPLRYISRMEVLNASETSIGDNITAIEKFDNIKTLLLNNIGMTKIDSINKLTNNKKEKEEELTLLELDISANSLKNIDGIEKINSLRKISITGNSLTEIPDLGDLTYLQRITAYSNIITKIPKLPNSGNLKYILLSDNKISDISELSKLSNIIELDLSNNLLDDDDLEKIKNIRISNSLKIAGNRITDISSIKSIISSASTLDISKNMIKDVSSIDDRFSKNGTLIANNQKIAVVLEQNDEETVLLDLPQIFSAAKNSKSYFYTANDFQLNNCTLQDNKLCINLKELGKNVATIKINGGKGNDSVLSVVPPIQTNISYEPSDWTNQDVTATISFINRDKVQITSNNENNKHVFNENGEFVFEYMDEYGVNGSTKAQVTWIDKESPKILGIVNNQVYQTAVTANVTDNHQLSSIKIIKDGNQEVDYISGTEISEVGVYNLIAKDTVNNETRITFTIEDKEEPEIPDTPDVPDTPVIPEKIESDYYIIDNDNKKITDIKPSTKLSIFKSKITTTSEYIIKDKNGNVLSDTNTISTGCIISTSLGDYKLVVKGDVNGDGNSDIRDILSINKHRLGKSNLKDEYLTAGDVNKDKKVDIRDILQINKYRLGKIDSL